jgi:hypothetical protein
MREFDDLLQVMPPHPGAGDVVDWSAAEQEWGVPFPADYRAFVETYGEGTVEDFLSILIPFSTEPLADPAPMRSETENARYTWGLEIGSDRPAGVDGSSLIAWGVDAGADILCWSVRGEDPDRWPVVVYCRQGWPAWQVYECGMVEFLLRTFRGEWPDCPLSGSDFWENPSPRFLHWREEERLRAMRRGDTPGAGEHAG